MAEQYYVLEQFKTQEQILAGLCETMPIKRKAIERYRQKNNLYRAKETYADLEGLKKKLLDAIRALGLLFLECDAAEDAEFCSKLYVSFKQFQLMTPDYGKLISVIETLMSKIPQTETASTKVIGRLMNNVKMGYYPTDVEHVKRIQAALEFPDSPINILDPCCGCGIAAEQLGEGKNAVTYGIEIDESRGQQAEERLNRVGFGSYFHSMVSHEAFHMLFLNPPYLSVMGTNGTKARSEKRFLVESLHHLMPEGVLVYIIPYYRLTWDICRVLCDNLRDISFYRFLDSEFAKFKQIVLFGLKKKKEDGSKQAEILSQYAMLPEKIPMIDTLPERRYQVPDKEKKVEIFKGAVFNLGELKRQMAKSNSINLYFEKSKIDAMEKRPLLPLKIGQVGLVGGSGLINGYVDCDEPHVIKGRVVKELRKRHDEDLGILVETRVNRMRFHILSPHGLKKLA